MMRSKNSEIQRAVARRSLLARRGRGARASIAVALVIAQLVACVLPMLAAPALAATIVSRGAATTATYGPATTTSLRGTVPAGTQAGDVLIATLGFGKATATAQPTLTAPGGWTLVSRTDQGTVGALAVYWHVFAVGETSYTWTTNVTVGGVVLVAAFGGADPANPIDAGLGLSDPTGGTSFRTPSVTTTAANDVLVASFFGTRSKSVTTKWTV